MSNPTELEMHLRQIVNPTWNYTNQTRTEKEDILNAAIGVASEAGEVLDEHKKLYFHKPKDRRDAIIDEVGDVYYYLLKLQELHGFTTQDALAANRKKLTARYPEFF
jgi:NTP pyrophosphatase (non-canonical NTP hydrolase)